MRIVAMMALVLFAASAAMAAVAAADVAAAPAKGKVTSVADNNLSFVITPKKGADVTVTVDKDTKYKLGDADSTMDVVVKVGNSVEVTLNDAKVATLVVGKAPKARKNG